eukprot:m.327899 g.327899  ORF g.327899 m.327899 type:complete len:95 (+) comp55586_c0_seq4:89-373(+)
MSSPFLSRSSLIPFPFFFPTDCSLLMHLCAVFFSAIGAGGYGTYFKDNWSNETYGDLSLSHGFALFVTTSVFNVFAAVCSWFIVEHKGEYEVLP